MSQNKNTVQLYMDSFNVLDHDKILSCLKDDVVWELPGVYCYVGKEAFDREIENPEFTGRPVIAVTRMIEENNVVIAEGTVQAHMATGEMIHLVFCDVFEMDKGKIRKLTSYLMEVKNQA